MAREVNGTVYLVGKEKAITKGFLGDTVNPDIVFLFVNKNGKKYYINHDILKNLNGKEEIRAGKFYELKRIDKGRSFSFEESKRSFDEKVINNVKADKTLQETIEFNTLIINRETDLQLKVKKKRNTILEVITLLIIISVYALSTNVKYAIPFIICLVADIIGLKVYITKMVKKLRNI